MTEKLFGAIRCDHWGFWCDFLGAGAIMVRLKCDRAKADRHVTECRAVLTDPELGGPVDLWISAIDSVAGVITISMRPNAFMIRGMPGGRHRHDGSMPCPPAA